MGKDYYACQRSFGMEHSLQVFLVFAFVRICLEEIDACSRRISPLLSAVAGCMVATRYRRLFLVAAAFLLLAGARRFVVAFSVVVASIFPVAIYGLISKLGGWYWLPNSIAMKGAYVHGFGVLTVFKTFLLHYFLALTYSFGCCRP